MVKISNSQSFNRLPGKVNANQYPGVYFTGTTRSNHTDTRYFPQESTPTMVECGVYDYLIPIGKNSGFWKIKGEWQTYYCDPETGKLHIIQYMEDIVPPVNKE